MKAKLSTTPRSMKAETATAVAGERARISAILESPEAKGREGTALRLALHSDMEVAEAIDLLATTPKSENPFVSYMDKVGHSGLPAQSGPVPNNERAQRTAEIAAAAAHVKRARGYGA